MNEDGKSLNSEWSSDMQEMIRKFYNSIDDAYELIGLEQLISFPHVVGVSRIYFMPTFAPTDVATFTFYSESIRIEVVEGATSLELSDLYPFDPCLVRRREYHLKYSKKDLGLFQSWASFHDHAVTAVDCWTPMCDGISYRHSFHDGNQFFDFKWFNPEPRECSKQLELLADYRRCIRIGRLRTWLPNLRFWRVRNRGWGP